MITPEERAAMAAADAEIDANFVLSVDEIRQSRMRDMAHVRDNMFVPELVKMLIDLNSILYCSDFDAEDKIREILDREKEAD